MLRFERGDIFLNNRYFASKQWDIILERLLELSFDTELSFGTRKIVNGWLAQLTKASSKKKLAVLAALADQAFRSQLDERVKNCFIPDQKDVQDI